MKRLFPILAIFLLTMCNEHVYDPAQDPNRIKPADKETEAESKSEITAPPSTITQWLDYKESPLSSFYKKYLDCDGLPILSSAAVSDTALFQARHIARTMLERIPAARDEMIKCHFRIGVVGYKENITDLPECKMMTVWWPETDWNERGRGYGATLAIPVMTIGEENLVKIPNFTERYKDESIMVHEFAHNIDFALRRIDSGFARKLDDAFAKAKKEGLWKGSYSMENCEEYFAEGAQAWYDNCRMIVPKKGGGSFKLVTRKQLESYDKALYDVLAGVFSEEKPHGYHFD